MTTTTSCPDCTGDKYLDFAHRVPCVTCNGSGADGADTGRVRAISMDEANELILDGLWNEYEAALFVGDTRMLDALESRIERLTALTNEAVDVKETEQMTFRSKNIHMRLTADEYRKLLDVLWYVNHQQEKLADFHNDPDIEQIRSHIMRNTALVMDDV